MKRVTADEAEAQFETLVSEVEATGDEVIIMRHGRSVARLVRTNTLPADDELKPEEIKLRRKALLNLPSE